MYDPSLVALNLEVCADALQAVQKSGTADRSRGRCAGPWRRLMRQLNRIEIGGGRRGRARANPAGKSAKRCSG